MESLSSAHRILRTVLRQYAAGARLQASVVRGCDKIARVMTLSYDFLHEHAIGRTSNESARTTMRSISLQLHHEGMILPK